MFEDDLHIVQTPRTKYLWDVTNFIDIMIVLLIFLVGTTTFSKVGIPLNQPESTTAAALPTKVLEIDMTPDGATFIDRQLVDTDALMEKVRETMKLDPNMVINIRTDKATMTGPLFAVVDACRDAGGPKFAFGALRK